MAVDQHAIHERIRYEYFMRKIFTQDTFYFKTIFTKSSKNSLKKYAVTLEPFPIDDKTINQVWDNKEKLDFLGITFKFSGDFLRILTYPKEAPMDVFKETLDLLHILSSNNKWFEVQHPIVSILKIFSCQNAIKFNDTISRSTADLLLKDLTLCDFPLFCIHGRNSLFPLMKL